MGFEMKSKRGQITIFIIVGILIVVAVILLLMLFNKARPDPQVNVIEDPEGFLEQCVNEHVEIAVEQIIENGGYVHVPEWTMDFGYPKGYYKQGIFEDVPYLCYTAINYARGIVTEPVLISHLEEEIYNFIEPRIEDCFEDFEATLIRENYETDFDEGFEFNVELIPGDVRVEIDKKIELKRTGEFERYDDFEINFETSIYDLAILIQEIIRQEVRMCNSDYIDLMRANTWAKIEKYQTGDNKIYFVEDTRNGIEMVFALRNCVLGVPS
jgi:hypothetical protein